MFDVFLCASSCGYHIQYFSLYVYIYLVNHRRSPHTCTAHTSHCCRQHVNVFCKPLLAHLYYVQLLCAHSVLRIGSLFASDGQPPCPPLLYSTDSDESPMAQWNQDALVALKGELKLNVITSTGLTDRLQRAAGGFMERAEVQLVESKPSNEQMGEVIRILLGKRNADFKIFCRILHESNYRVWADQLEKKAREFRGEPGTHVLKSRGRIRKDLHYLLILTATP